MKWVDWEASLVSGKRANGDRLELSSNLAI